MPMIDVYAPADLFPAGTDGLLGKELTMAVLRAEGVATPGPFHLNNTAAFIHRMDPRAVHTAATNSARTVRVQVITPPAALTREGQKQLVKEITNYYQDFRRPDPSHSHLGDTHRGSRRRLGTLRHGLRTPRVRCTRRQSGRGAPSKRTTSLGPLL